MTPADCVFTSHRGCRQSSVQQAATAFTQYCASCGIRLTVAVKPLVPPSSEIDGLTSSFVVRVMEGQEALGAGRLLEQAAPNEIFVELASYAYQGAPTDHVIKYENGVADAYHQLTHNTFGALIEKINKLPRTSSETSFVRRLLWFL